MSIYSAFYIKLPSQSNCQQKFNPLNKVTYSSMNIVLFIAHLQLLSQSTLFCPSFYFLWPFWFPLHLNHSSGDMSVGNKSRQRRSHGDFLQTFPPPPIRSTVVSECCIMASDQDPLSRAWRGNALSRVYYYYYFLNLGYSIPLHQLCRFRLRAALVPCSRLTLALNSDFDRALAQDLHQRTTEKQLKMKLFVACTILRQLLHTLTPLQL